MPCGKIEQGFSSYLYVVKNEYPGNTNGMGRLSTVDLLN
jgi:hypothetical protein